jgi:UDPglucose--hexose-1-phosphate uridylyltransferase
MAEIRKDPISDRWVIIQTDNPMRPDDFELDQEPASSGICPFCPGHEELTPPEITRAGSSGSGWTIRVVPNKFPALLRDEPLASKEAGPYSMLSGFGGHEVIIETPDHTQELQNLSDDQIRSLFRMYQSRAQLLQKDRRFRYILIFKNFGESAGASLAHPHSQLIAHPGLSSTIQAVCLL